MDLKIAICDDDKDYINTIEKYIDDVSENGIECDTYYSGEELIVAYTDKGLKYDIIFLDMEMDGLNGIETANKIRETDRRTVIIFVTSHKKYMKKSFECSPFRFLVKPLDFMEFKDAFLKACKAVDVEHPYIVFQSAGNIIKLFYEDILYFENKSHWVYIYTFEQEHRIYTTFAKLLKQLDTTRFAHTHKSYIINLDYFKELHGNDIVLVNNKKIPLSRNFKNDVKQRIIAFNERKYLI